MMRFRDKTAIVTGATGGIGREVCARLAAEGANVLLVVRDAAAGEQLAGGLAGAAAVVAGDLREPGFADRVVTGAIERFGGLDVLVNNAGIDHTGTVLETPLDDVRDVFEVNFFAAFSMLQAAAAAMVERGGSIVNVTSRLASIGVPTMAIYGASKGALLALTRGAAIELAPRIRVNAVAPGLTEGPLADRWFALQDEPGEFRRGVEATVPQGRLGTPREVAAAIAFLASEEAAHITGASLAIDGGYTAA